VSALSYYLEREGMLTTGISLVRENTESMQPPRALWVTFPLGRPLGKPGDAAFQLDVIRAALDLLNRSEGPVLADYPHDAPTAEAADAPACPVSFARDGDDDGTWNARLGREIHALRPWYELSRRRRGRTLVGLSDRSPEENVETLADHLDRGALPADVTWLKRAVEDIKAYYIEAMTAQPGSYDGARLQTQIWQETCLGAAIIELYHRFRNCEDDRLKLVVQPEGFHNEEAWASRFPTALRFLFPE